MSMLIVSEFVTLDGVMEAPGGEPTHPHTNWVPDYFCPEVFAYKLEEILGAEVLLAGRVTYESFAGAWPEREGPMAEKLNSMPKVVVSATLTDPEWNNTTVLAGDVAQGVAKLKEATAGPVLVHGSATLVHTLLDHDLVDELRLMVFPLSIGAGLRVFPETHKKTPWRLVETTPYPTGVRNEVYRPG
jgi:dihydrofolate reductase